MKLFQKLPSFTLIELLIVIVIISILAVSILPKIKDVQNKAKIARVKSDFNDFKEVVLLAQTTANKKLKDITLRTNTVDPNSEFPEVCLSQNLQKLPSNHLCRTKRIDVLRRIESAALLPSGALSHMETDPRGAPYVFGNGEGNGGTPCGAALSHNNIDSAGPDGLLNANYFGWYNTGSTDDIKDKYRSAFCPDAY